MTDYGGLIRVLADSHVDFVLVGGLAAVVHGSARLTLDVDVVYSRSPENLGRIPSPPWPGTRRISGVHPPVCRSDSTR
jgi:hypothetical protein